MMVVVRVVVVVVVVVVISYMRVLLRCLPKVVSTVRRRPFGCEDGKHELHLPQLDHLGARLLNLLLVFTVQCVEHAPNVRDGALRVVQQRQLTLVRFAHLHRLVEAQLHLSTHHPSKLRLLVHNPPQRAPAPLGGLRARACRPGGRSRSQR